MDLTIDSLDALDVAIESQSYSDYLYMYPPRQAYRPLSIPGSTTEELVFRSLQKRPDANLYIHIPFCRQICRFCNLYTTPLAAARPGEVDRYVSRLIDELGYWKRHSSGARWKTLYFGGGSPNVLTTPQLGRLLDAAMALTGETSLEEIAIELAPELANETQLRDIRELGFDRISMGYQSADSEELKLIGRGYQASRQADLAASVLSMGFQNLCLDLIFGLPGQGIGSWINSLRDVAAMGPHTICAYQWTRRPHTGFSGMENIPPASGPLLREMYRVACDLLADEGYRQETHVRWTRNGGGYLQKEYHWASDSLIGVGAGARSYFWEVDVRNEYSLVHRRNALSRYLSPSGAVPIWLDSPEGFRMSQDERVRKSLVLGLQELDIAAFQELHGISSLDRFGDQLSGLVARGLLVRRSQGYEMTPDGLANRDLIVQLFYSQSVRESAGEYGYDQ